MRARQTSPANWAGEMLGVLPPDPSPQGPSRCGNPSPLSATPQGAGPVWHPFLLPLQSPHILPVCLGVLPISLGAGVPHQRPAGALVVGRHELHVFPLSNDSFKIHRIKSPPWSKFPSGSRVTQVQATPQWPARLSMAQGPPPPHPLCTPAHSRCPATLTHLLFLAKLEAVHTAGPACMSLCPTHSSSRSLLKYYHLLRDAFFLTDKKELPSPSFPFTLFLL